MVNARYDYRIVGRNSLAALEKGVRELQRKGWELHRPEYKEATLSLEDALDACAPPDVGGSSTGHLLSVSMRKLQTETPDEG